MATGASGNLRQLGQRSEVAVLPPVKFAPLGKGYMVDIHVQPHADGIGRNQKINLAGLIHLNLRIAGAWAQASHHHGGPAALLTNDFGNGIDIFGRKSRHGRASWQAR